MKGRRVDDNCRISNTDTVFFFHIINFAIHNYELESNNLILF
jgi:hypothetical protein